MSDIENDQPVFHGFPNGIAPLGENLQVALPVQGEELKAQEQAHTDRALAALQRILVCLDGEQAALTSAEGHAALNGVKSKIAFCRSQFAAKLAELSGSSVGG